MLFESALRGKIIIHIEEKDGMISSHITRKGKGREDKAAISAILATYISMCETGGKDPEKLLEKNLGKMKKIIRNQKT